MVDARPMPAPTMSSLKLDTSGAVFDKPLLYRSVVGGLQYATITRPDIVFTVNKVSQFSHTPLEQHWKVVKPDPVDRKSYTEYYVILGLNLFCWSSKKHVSVSRSSTEAEFRALADAMTNIMWLQKLLFEMYIPLDIAPTLFCDNQSTVLMSRNPIHHNRSKHFEIDLHFVQDRMVQLKARVVHIPSFD
ncbi:uncharacterized protein LOC107616034 [Arachis ipaensis]|uniref:uncharacterized protein LOC107616034 n=1 Tax=Arachis ipaensis TaxID=130454 RepID=UPI0007AF39EF|nr:uncharacterized protein LOC107616034 [Arachis ipaensis]